MRVWVFVVERERLWGATKGRRGRSYLSQSGKRRVYGPRWSSSSEMAKRDTSPSSHYNAALSLIPISSHRFSLKTSGHHLISPPNYSKLAPSFSAPGDTAQDISVSPETASVMRPRLCFVRDTVAIRVPH